MSKQTNTATTPTSSASFTNQFDILARSGVGVVLCHAREPHRAEAALRQWAFSKTRPFWRWDCLTGWVEHKPDPTYKPKNDKATCDPGIALRRIDDLDGTGDQSLGGKDRQGDKHGMFVMSYPHWWVDKAPQMIQCLKHYVRSFSTTKQRLVLVVPEGVNLPKELENDVVTLDMELPNREELKLIYDGVMEVSLPENSSRVPFNPEEVEAILSLGGGMTEMEFETAVSKATITNKATWPNTPIADFLRVISETKVEVVRRSEVLELMPSGVLNEVGGLDILKSWIGELSMAFSPEAKAYGVDTPKGCALIGPPGTGKSVSAKAIAAALQQPLIRFDVGRVFGSLVGQSEQRVRSALNLLKAMSPCVAFIDEVDKAGIDPRQSGGDSGVGKRVMGAILTFMQENTAPIFWVMTANRTQGLPPEMLRKGRLDEVFAIQPPNEVERMEVLKIHLRKRKQNPDAITDLGKAVAASDGFVSAELEAAVKEAVLRSFTTQQPVTGALIAAQLGQMKPISIAFAEDFQAMKTWADQNARPASSPSGSVADDGTVTVLPPAGTTRRRRTVG